MKTRVIVIIAASVVAAAAVVLTTSSDRLPKAPQQDVGSVDDALWLVDVSLGFPFSTVKDEEWPGLEGYQREVLVLLEDPYFSEGNLKKLFEYLAEKYAEPTLFVRARTSKEAIKEALEFYGPQKFCISPIQEQEPASAQNRDEGRGPSWADYYRIGGKEEFIYTSPDRAGTTRVIVRVSAVEPLPYTGDANEDLLLAAKVGNTTRVSEVLGQGADIDAVDNHGNTATMLAIWNGFKDVFSLLMERGPDLGLQNREGWTALHFAATRNDLGFLQKLLEKQVDLNVKNRSGNTALMLSAARGLPEHVRVLLAAGASLDLANAKGETALQRARSTNIGDMLRQAGAKR